MKDLVIQNEAGNPVCKVSYNEITEVVDIIINKPINLQINGNLGTEINGECDLTVHGDMRIDTFLAKLFINSYISKYIKDHPDAVEKQRQIEDHNKNYEEWMELNKEKMIEFAKEYLFKDKEK